MCDFSILTALCCGAIVARDGHLRGIVLRNQSEFFTSAIVILRIFCKISLLKLTTEVNGPAPARIVPRH